MKETRFIGQNKEKWAELEALLKSKERNPDQLSDLFIQVSDDLSYARSHYPNRVVRIYLNQLSQQVFTRLQRNTVSQLRLFIRFWKMELPMALYHSRVALLWSFIVFFLSFLVGVLSSVYEPDFARSILGDSYVDMTNQNIAAGNPTAVYQDSSALEMFFRIALNNITIALRTFLFGLLFAVGTLGVMLYNGVMLGTFQHLFVGKNVLFESILSIWMHGTFEISAIILSGGAGLVLGSGLVFPGTYTRIQALRRSARHGIRIMILAVTMLFVAAVIESWITRLVTMSDWLRLTLILAMLALVLFYVIFYPRKVAMSGAQLHQDSELQAVRPFDPELKEMKSGGQLFGTSFGAFFNLLPTLAGHLFLLTLPFVIWCAIDESRYWQYTNLFSRFEALINSLSAVEFGLWFVPALILCGVWLHKQWVQRFDPGHKPAGMVQQVLFLTILLVPAWLLLTLTDSIWPVVLLMPYLIFMVSGILLSRQARMGGLKEPLNLLSSGFLQATGLYIGFFVLSALFLLLSGMLPDLLKLDMIEMLFNWDETVYGYYFRALSAVFQFYALLLVVMVFYCGNFMLWYSLRERESGANLREKLNQYHLADAE